VPTGSAEKLPPPNVVSHHGKTAAEHGVIVALSVPLKLYVYGYLNAVQSSRRLEREAGRNVKVMWLTRRLVPDHRTIAEFKRARDNLGAF